MCLEPSFIYISRAGKWERQPVSCKRCWRCQRNRLNDYVGRCLAEASVREWVVVVTLTYADWQQRGPVDDLADVMLTPPHFQKFVRALRKRGHSIRYLCAGEYGSLKGRAHFHALIFGDGPKPDFPQRKQFHHPTWPHGYMFADWASDERAIRYVCKYLLKDQEHKDGKKQSWFSLSKKPALGAEWFARKAEMAIEAGVMPSSFHYVPPGGSSGRTYLMTGHTRRRYCAQVAAGLIVRGMFDRKKINEWVLKAYDAAVKEAWERRLAKLPPEEVAEAYATFYDRTSTPLEKVLDRIGREDRWIEHCNEEWERRLSECLDEGISLVEISAPPLEPVVEPLPAWVLQEQRRARKERYLAGSGLTG